MLIIKQQKAILFVVYKCIHKFEPRYLQGMFFLKYRDYDYWDHSITKLQKYNTIKHDRKHLILEDAKLWNSINTYKNCREHSGSYDTTLNMGWNALHL